MGLDLRLPIGAMFVLIGALLAGYGLVSETRIYDRSLGYNVNLIWGVALLAFGTAMVALAKWSVARQTRARTAADGSDRG